jgi:hypothetical protein
VYNGRTKEVKAQHSISDLSLSKVTIYHLSSHTISLGRATVNPSHSPQQRPPITQHAYSTSPGYQPNPYTHSVHLKSRRHSIRIEIPLQLPLQLRALQARSLASRLDRILLLRVRAGEDDIQLFQTAAFGLGEEEPDAGKDGGVEDGEHQISFPLEVGKSRWGDHDDQEVGEPVRAGRQGVCLDSDAEVCDFGWAGMELASVLFFKK